MTVQQVYQTVCFVLLEDNGFVLGVYSEAQFLRALSIVLLDFCQRAGLYKHIYTQQIEAGTSEYVVPDLVMAPEVAFVGGRLIEKVAEDDLTQSHLDWKQRQDLPQRWHEDGMVPKRVQAFPEPNYTGAAVAGDGYGDFQPTGRNLTLVGTAAPSQTAWELEDTLDGVPDSFCHYLAYGVLAQIFGDEAETRDVQRALYCQARYREGLALAQAIAREELLEDERA
jgi:hypothetical protein